MLPLLFALVFVELLLPEDRRISLTRAGPFVLASLTLLVGAEITCLRVIEENRPPGWWEDMMVSGGLMFPSVVLVTIVATPIVSAISESVVGAIALAVYFVALWIGFMLIAFDVIGFTALLAFASLAPVGAGVVLAFEPYAKAVLRGVQKVRRRQSGEVDDDTDD